MKIYITINEEENLISATTDDDFHGGCVEGTLTESYNDTIKEWIEWAKAEYDV